MNQNALRARLLRWEWLLVALIVIVAIVNTRLSPFFLNTNNLLRTTSDFMEIGIMVLPMVFIIVTGNIDLSIASTLGLSASLMGWLYMGGWNVWLAVLSEVVLYTALLTKWQGQTWQMRLLRPCLRPQSLHF